MLRPRAFQNDGGIGKGKQADARAQQALGRHQHSRRGFRPQKSAYQKPTATQAHTPGTDAPGVKSAAEPRGHRRCQSLHHRLQGQKKACLPHVHALAQLQVQAEKKDDPKKRAVIDKGNQ